MTPLLAITGTLALGHSLFLAAYFWRKNDGLRRANLLLAGLLLALAVRITKSVLIVLFPATGVLAPACGLVGMAAIGPLLYGYLSAMLDGNFGRTRHWWWHLAFPGFLVVAVPFLDGRAMFVSYALAALQLLVYLLAGARLVWKKRSERPVDAVVQTWFRLLLGGAGLIWAVFFLQLFIETQSTYILVTTCAAAVLYALSFWGMEKMTAITPLSGVFQKNKIRNTETVPDHETTALADRVKSCLDHEKMHTDPNLTVAKLAARLGVPPYQLSRAVNAVFGKSFPELLNEYRIAESTGLLLQPDYDYLSIEGIAGESGFNSLSAFYAAFKKINGTTPAEWRRQQMLS